MIAETKLQSWEFALFTLVTLSKRATRANCSQRYLLKDQRDRIALIVLYKKSDKSKSLFLRVLLFFEEKTGLWNLYHAFWLCFYFFGGSGVGLPLYPEILQYTQWLCLSSEVYTARDAGFEPGTTANEPPHLIKTKKSKSLFTKGDESKSLLPLF